MSSLSARTVCYIHALGCRYLELLHFHVLFCFFFNMVPKGEYWWLAPDFLSASTARGSHCMGTALLFQETKKTYTYHAFEFRHCIQMPPVKEFWNSHGIFTCPLWHGQPTERQAFVSVYLSYLLLGPPAPRQRWRSNPPKRRKKKETATFRVWGHSRTQFPTWQYNTLTIWVTGPSPTVTSISRSIYQFNSFIFLITKLLSLWACAERLWLLIKMELY